MLSGLSMFHPLLFWLSALFGSGQWARAIHPWIGCVLLDELRRDSSCSSGATISGTGTTSPGWALSSDVLRNEEETVPEVGRFNAGQKFVFWSMALLVPALFLTGLVIWEVYFGAATSIETQRAAALIHSYLAIAAIIIWITHVYAAIWVRGSMRGDDAGLGHARLGVAPSPQMAAQSGGDRIAWAAPATRRRRFVRQGETAPKGGWIGNASGGVKAPEPIVLPDPGRRFSRTAERLERLADGHAAEGWLAFMAEASRAQAAAAAKLPCASRRPTRPPSPRRSRRAFRRSPPTGIAATRPGATALRRCIESFDATAAPASAAATIAEMRRRDPAQIESLADAFLRGGVDPADAGAAFWIAAALQVYFTRLAATLAGRRPQAARAARSLPLMRLDLVGRRDHRVRPESRRALSPLLALLDRLESHPRRLHRLRRLAHARAARN